MFTICPPQIYLQVPGCTDNVPRTLSLVGRGSSPYMHHSDLGGFDHEPYLGFCRALVSDSTALIRQEVLSCFLVMNMKYKARSTRQRILCESRQSFENDQIGKGTEASDYWDGF